MKAIFGLIAVIFIVTATITHIWTVIIAYSESGIFASILTFLFPFLSEVYWMFRMFGENDAYAYTALTHLILVIPISIFSR